MPTIPPEETHASRCDLIPQSAFSRVLWGLGLGIFCGFFFGEPAGKLEIVGQAYIRLLQITVLPYILVSLIGGLGRLDADIARRIGAVGGILILLIWGLTHVSNLLLPLVYPEWETAAFFSTSPDQRAGAVRPAGTLHSV